jgi:hypothetical protein
MRSSGRATRELPDPDPVPIIGEPILLRLSARAVRSGLLPTKESTIAMNPLASSAENEKFVRCLYRACLDREPDSTGWDHFVGGLRDRTMSWDDVLRAVLNSEEFRIKQRLRESVPTALQSLHESRVMLMQQYIPPAERVVDLGGASDHDPEGALFAMGYPYTPKELLIIDLPPEDRFTRSRTENRQIVQAARGTHIEYCFRSMSDLGFLEDSSVDLVVSGESIEHISEDDADAVCVQVFRILKPGGHFCLDTPNAGLTRLQSPTQLIHPEHKKEYYVSELRQKLVKHGFHIVRELGINPMPRSLESRSFDYQEMTQNKCLSDDAEIGYCFYLDARK